MKPLFFSLFIIGSFTVYGQLPKKQRRLLLADCASEQQKQEEALAVFRKAGAEFDSVKLQANDQVRFLKQAEKKVLDRFFTYSGLLYQLKQLQADVPSLISSFNSDEVPVQEAFVEPVKPALTSVFVFEKVTEKTDMGDLSVKEQNKVLKRKLEEYKRYSLSNAVRQEEMKQCESRITAFLPRMDSLLNAYNRIANDLTSDSWKMQDRLNQIEANFRKKGPAGFPEAYFRVFPEVFPGFMPVEQDPVMDAVPVYYESERYPNPIAVEQSAPEVFDYTEEPAAFVGGKSALDQFIAKNIRRPESVEQGIIRGNVYVKFIVSETGEISAVNILKGIPACPECGEEAIRLINSMPNWIPAKQSGKAVKSYVGLPVKFE